MTGLLTAIGLLAVLATVLPLLRLQAWWIRICDFPRLQIAAVLIATLVLYLALAWEGGLAQSLFVAALCAALAWQARMVFPYTPLAPRQVQASAAPRDDACLRLLFANVLMTNRNAARLQELVRDADPDVFLAVEADAWWQAQLRDLQHHYPHSLLQPQENTYGMLFYSRLEVLRADVKFLVQADVPSIHARVRLPSGAEVELRCLHPRPPVPSEDDSSTGRDAELLLVAREIRERADPVVVMGDLNDVAWSRTSHLFRDISGLLDPRVGRGFYHTWHAGHFFIRVPLDHFFHSSHFRLVDFRRLPAFGSDHFPVYIRLSFEPAATAEQAEPQASQEQHKEAGEKIAKAR